MGNKKWLILTAVVFISLVPLLVLAGTIDLPVTGQTKCYDAAGTEIDCAGTGQDGEIRAGVAWPNPRFTNPDGSTPINGDCVLDRLTGLIWPRNGNHGIMPWDQAIDYANNFTLCGYSDWHLPNINQLESLVNADESDPATWLNAQGFYNVKEHYWSATTYAIYAWEAWYVRIGHGNTYHGDKNIDFDIGHGDTYPLYVWPVHSIQQSTPDPTYPANIWKTGQKTSYYTGDDGDLQRGVTWPDPRFTDNGDGTVTDNLTGLMWLRDANCISTEYPSYSYYGSVTGEQALDFVKGVNNGTYSNCGAGYYDWRLPNRKELMSLIDRSRYDPALPPGYPFIHMQSLYFASTSSTKYTNIPWHVKIGNGYMNVWQDYDGYVWPVRGGQVGAPVSYYCDKDNDGYLNSSVDGTCAGIGCVSSGCRTSPGNDCNDLDYAVSPGKTEGPWGDAACADGKDNNCNGFTDTADSSCLLVNADLVVTTVTGPSAGAIGSPVTFGDTTKNNGPGSVPASTTRFYWSADSTHDAGDTYLGGRAIPSFAPGSASTGSISVTIPAGACSGTSYIIAKADADNLIAETNETNNPKSKSIKAGPDLIVSALTVPLISGAGKTISVMDTTKNQGGCPSVASATKLYLSSNSTWDAGDIYLGEGGIPALAGGATDTGITSVSIPDATATGTYYIIARSDADNTNPNETSETNNNMRKSIKIGPDLVVSALIAPSSAVRGSTISVTDTTRNQGGGDAAASITKLYLSTNTTYDAGDTNLGERGVPALTAGATNTGSTNVTIPAVLSVGPYYIIAVSDADGVVTETIGTNNNRVKSLTINP